MTDRYTVINKEEGRGQSVAENGIPCTARHCVTQLNRLFRDNEKLELEIIGLESKLKAIEFVLKYDDRKLNKEKILSQLLIELYKEIDKNYNQSIENNDELSINYEKSKLDLITKIFDEVNKID